MAAPLVSVITLAHNKLAVTRRCLNSLLGTVGAAAAWELIVVDNGCTDGTGAWLKEFRAQAAAVGVEVTVLRNESNLGCSTARNEAVAAARGEHLVFIDNDVALRSGNWLSVLSQALLTLPSASMVGVKLVYPFRPYNIQCAGVGISASGRVQFRGRGQSRTAVEFNRLREVQCLISACCMVKATAFHQAGGFDEHFNPVQFEDFDLCYKLRRNGGRVYYLPTVEMYHFESVTTAGTVTLPNTRVIVMNGIKFKKRWHGMFQHEDGPEDCECRWRDIEAPRFEEIGELPML